MEFNGEIIRGLYDCINKLLGDSEMEKIVHKELAQYKAASGMFGSTTVKAMRGEVAPAKGVAAKNKGKRVGVVEEAEASEDSSSEEDELVPNADFIHSDGEEAEGFLNEQNHHVEINYADIDDEEED
ncbi:hypothetical protein SESBI_48543 [Sesbania bispinosa]|nr:hypothetical protein SESBI_48543 [Sesbania bispinosa]